MFCAFCYLRQFGERVTSLKKPSLPVTQAEIRDFVRGGGGGGLKSQLCVALDHITLTPAVPSWLNGPGDNSPSFPERWGSVR